jgi:hypothetical protein
MKKIDTGQAIAIVANLGVVAGLVFLAVELQQANRIAIASTEIEVRNNFSSVNETFYVNREVAELMEKTTDPNATLSDAEVFRIGSIVRRLMNAWLAIETAYANGLVPESTFNTIEDDIRFSISNFPAARPIWRDVADVYSAQRSRETFELIYQVLEEFGA